MRCIPLLLVLFFFSCSSSVDKKQASTLRINIEQDPQTLDPRKSRSLAERNLMGMLFEGLTREGKEGKSELSLAESYIQSEDGLQYTFLLKEAKWSNGDPITAQDFIDAWQTALSPSFAAENAYQLFCIKNAKEIKEGKKEVSQLGAYACGDRTLQIVLENKVPYFLELLSFPVFFPIHEKSYLKGEPTVFSGPFICKQWKHNDSIELVKNDHYFDADEVKISSIYLTMVTPETEMQMFERGELDWAGSPISSLSLDRMEEYKKNNTLCYAPMLGTKFFRVNTQDPFLHNVNIRKALAFAMHRHDIVDHVLQGYQKVALQFLPTSSLCYVSDASEEEAKELLEKGLEEIGITKEKMPKITLLCVSNQQNRLLAQAVQQDWKKALGIDVSIEVNEAKVYYQKVDRKEYQIALGSWMADYNDNGNFLSIFKTKASSNNNTDWENEEYTALLEMAENCVGEERESKLLQCESILMREMPILPIYHYSAHYLKSDRLQGERVSLLGNVDFKYAHLNSGE